MSMNNNRQAAPAPNISIPARINEEPAQNSITSVSPSPASPHDGHNFIFPTVDQVEQEIGIRQQQITDLRQEIGPENLLDYTTQEQRNELANVNQPKKVVVSPKLECPFRKNVSYAGSYFIIKYLREKHNYRLSLDEERLANETLEKAMMERSLAVLAGRREIQDETFLEEHGQEMTVESAEAGDLLPSFRGRRKNTNEIETGIATKQRKMNYTDKKLKMRPVVNLRRLKPEVRVKKQILKPKEKKNPDEKLTKDNLRVVIEKLDLKKNPYSAHIEPKLKPDEKLLKLKPVVNIRKLNLQKNPYYKKRPK